MLTSNVATIDLDKPLASYDIAAQVVASLNPDTAARTANDAYLDGDHYQKGEAWGGPPVPTDMDGYAETIVQLEKDQAPVPVLSEMAEDYVTGVVGTEPAFSIVLARELAEDEEITPNEETDIGLLNDALTAFYDGCGASEVIQEFVENLCSGRGVLRPLVPPAVVENEIGIADLMDAAQNIYIEAPKWDAAGVVNNPRSMQKTGVYLYSQKVGDGVAKRAEITTVTPDGKTVFRVLEEEVVKDEREYDCAGNIWLFQATLAKPILGKAQRALQRKIDFLNYILPKNAQYAGFRSRDFFGVNEPGEAPRLGPGIVSFWQPSVIEIDGEKKVSAATLQTTEPVDSTPIRQDLGHLIEVLLKSRHLLHTMISGDAMASAISRVQSRAQFTRALYRMKVKVERVLRDLFTTVLCLACQFAGEDALLERLKTDYRVRVDVRIDAGPMTPEERAAVISTYGAGLIDRETAQTMLGIEDVGSVNNALSHDEATNIDLQIKRATLFTEYVQTFDASEAAFMADLPQDKQDHIKTIEQGGGDNGNNTSGQ